MVVARRLSLLSRQFFRERISGYASRMLRWNTHLSKTTISTYVLKALHK
ncbi:hypothetical protein BT93_K2270 [Corymbia citriodora subsp. variegata]|nr:hypothetical protein BT93_K2270 [Corymbia citriodora subsp. variegata]